MKIILDKEFKELIPPLTAEEFEQLEKNILNEGIREPLIVWSPDVNCCPESCPECGEMYDELNTDGICEHCDYHIDAKTYIIDGHNRFEIATKYNLPYKTVLKEFNSREDVIQWMINNQLGRRNLSDYVKYELIKQYEEIEKKKGRNKMSEGGKGLSTNDKPSHDTRKVIANKLNISTGKKAQCDIIDKKAPEEIKEKLRKNEMTINQAYQQVKKQEKIKSVEEKFTNTKESKSIDIYNTKNKYNIILADPAWQYWDGGQKNQSLHYKTMTIEDICKLPIKDIADNDCILFLWVTFPILQDCFKVIESWGFKYSTCGFNWIKKNKSGNGNFFGCGSWTRANSELCLIATKGQVLRLDASISQIIESPIEEHSKKPAIIRELITKLVGELPRIELFSRNSVNGWDCWGNEV